MKKTKDGITVTEIEIDGKVVPLYKIPPRFSGLDGEAPYRKKKPKRTTKTDYDESLLIGDEPTEDFESLDPSQGIQDAYDNFLNTGDINDSIDDLIDPLNPWGISESQLY